MVGPEGHDLFSTKVTKANDAPSDWANAREGWVDQLAALKQSPPIYFRVHPGYRRAGVAQEILELQRLGFNHDHNDIISQQYPDRLQ